MTITAAMTAALAVLTEALDEPGTDIAHSLHQLTLAAAAAVPSYLGLSVLVPQSDPHLICTTLPDENHAGDMQTSLQVLLPTFAAIHDSAVSVILYATTPGTFVDLAADLVWLTGRPPETRHANRQRASRAAHRRTLDTVTTAGDGRPNLSRCY